MIGAGGRIRRIRRSAPIATRRKNYRGYRESKLRIVGHLRMKGWAVQMRELFRPMETGSCYHRERPLIIEKAKHPASRIIAS